MTCFYCDSTQGPFVRDHFVPASLGGGDRASNRVDACWYCDRRKGSLHPRDWLRICPPAGTARVLAKIKKLGLGLDDPDAEGHPGRVETPLQQPMPPPSWSKYARPKALGGVRSLREHAAHYLQLRSS